MSMDANNNNFWDDEPFMGYMNFPARGPNQGEILGTVVQKLYPHILPISTVSQTEKNEETTLEENSENLYTNLVPIDVSAFFNESSLSSEFTEAHSSGVSTVDVVKSEWQNPADFNPMHQRGFAENASSASWLLSSSSDTVDLKYPNNMLDITSDQPFLVRSFVSESDEQNQVESTRNFYDLSQAVAEIAPEQISLPESQTFCYLKDDTTDPPSFILYPLEIQFIPISNPISCSELETSQNQTMIIEDNVQSQCAIATVSKLRDQNKRKVKDEEEYVKFREKNTLNTRKSRERKRLRDAILKEQLLAFEKEHKELLQQLTLAMKEREELMERLTEAKMKHEQLTQRLIETEAQAELQ